MRRAYVTANRLAELRQLLTPDDWTVIEDMATMRVAGALDLQALQNLRRPLSVRRFRHRLATLSELQVITRLGRSVGGSAAGSAGFIYGLGPAGQRLLHHGGRARPAWTPRPAWLAHALVAGRLYVELRQLESDGQLKLVRFDAEPACWRSFTGEFGDAMVLKPDAYVETSSGSYEDRWFVEVDMATEGVTTLRQKFDRYRRYWHSGEEQQAHDVFPRVLWLVPTEARRQVLVDVAAGQPPEAWPLHCVALQDDATAVFTEPP